MRKQLLSTSAAAERGSGWLNRFAWLTALSTLLLICSGGMVTSKGAGLAVPDWPTTFGYNMFMFPASRWVGGILFEHTHRLIASTVGLLTVILSAWLWYADRRRWVGVLGAAAVIGVILQGVLGGLRVTMLKDEIGIFHACLAQAFFGLLVFIALVTSRLWRIECLIPDRTVAVIATVTTALIYMQLALGAVMRHQHRDLAITDFPTAYRHWIPDTSPVALARINAARDAVGLSDVSAGQIWLQMVHRFGAVLVALGVITLFIRVRSKRLPALVTLSLLWLSAIVAQISLGAWIIWSNKAADIATAHVALGAVSFGLGVIICALCLRQSFREQTPELVRADVVRA